MKKFFSGILLLALLAVSVSAQSLLSGAWPTVTGKVLTNAETWVPVTGASRAIPVIPGHYLILQPVLASASASTSNVVFSFNTGLNTIDFNTNLGISRTTVLTGTNWTVNILPASNGTNVEGSFISLDKVDASTTLTNVTIRRLNYQWVPVTTQTLLPAWK